MGKSWIIIVLTVICIRIFYCSNELRFIPITGKRQDIRGNPHPSASTLLKPAPNAMLTGAFMTEAVAIAYAHHETFAQTDSTSPILDS
jgi:hypothetical protein